MTLFKVLMNLLFRAIISRVISKVSMRMTLFEVLMNLLISTREPPRRSVGLNGTDPVPP